MRHSGLILGAAVACAGCYDGPTSESSVFDCYCTQQIADMLNTALDIANANDEAMRDDCEAFALDAAAEAVRDRADPAFSYHEYRIDQLEQRIVELEATISRECSSPDP